MKPNGTTKTAKPALARIEAATKAHKAVTATITITDAAGHVRAVKRKLKLT